MIKRFWAIPVVKDLFWFFILIIFARGLWLGIEHTDALNEVVHLNKIQASISQQYVTIIDALLLRSSQNYELSDAYTFYFPDQNKSFSITAGCSALSHYFYFTFLTLLFPLLKIKHRILLFLPGVLLLIAGRILILRLQMEVFLHNTAIYNSYFHAEAKYLVLSIIFFLWLAMIEIRNKYLKPPFIFT